MNYVAYCDGSSTGKIGKAGAACAVFLDNSGILIARPLSFNTGNNVAEMAACYLVFQELPPNSHCTICTDSNNVIQWLTDKYRRNNPQIEDVYQRIKRVWKDKNVTIKFIWIRGHSNNKWNNICDLAAKEAKSTDISIRKVVSYE